MFDFAYFAFTPITHQILFNRFGNGFNRIENLFAKKQELKEKMYQTYSNKKEQIQNGI